MDETIMKEFVDCLRNNPEHAFDFISQNGHLFSKEELKGIVKELLYAIHANVTVIEHDEILSDAADDLDYLIY